MVGVGAYFEGSRKTFPLRLSLVLAFTFAIYMAILSISNDDTNNGISLLIATTAGITAILTFYFFLRRYLVSSLLKYALVFFILRLSIGVLHYLVFFDAKYLSLNYTDFAYLDEYVWLFDSMELFSAGTAGTADAESVAVAAELNKNYEMIYLMSFLFYFGGTKALTVATFNALMTIYAAFFVYLIAFKINKNVKNATFCFFIVAIQPFEIITSILSRDTFGQMLIFYSVFLLVYFFSTNTIVKVLPVLFASWISSLVREVYFMIPLVAGLGSNLFYSLIYHFRNFKKTYIAVFIFSILSLAALTPLLIDTFFWRFLDIDIVEKILRIPVSAIYSLVGPFPWTQVLYRVTGFEYHIPGYLTSVFNLTLFLSLILFLLNKRPSRSQFMILFIFSLFYLSGILVYGGRHTVYYSICIPLLALFDLDSRKTLFIIRFIMIFIFFLILNFIYVM